MKTNNETIHHAHALDLLDYFAAAALQGIVANPEHTHLTTPQVAKMAYTFATAMLTAREQNKSEKTWVTHNGSTGGGAGC